MGGVWWGLGWWFCCLLVVCCGWVLSFLCLSCWWGGGWGGWRGMGRRGWGRGLLGVRRVRSGCGGGGLSRRWRRRGVLAGLGGGRGGLGLRWGGWPGVAW
ncbi:hypothetical protein VSS95_27970, partial [Pseudomonas syringae pv. tagetis]